MKLSELAASRWQTRQDQRIAVAVALAESRGKMDAENHNTDGSVDCGPWQVNSVHGYDCERLKSDPNYTADAAYAVWKSSGWSAWTTYKTGAYVMYLGRDADLTTGGGGASSASFNPLTDIPNPLNPLGPLNPFKGAIPNPLHPLDAAKGVVHGVDAIGNVIGALSNPSTWARFGKGFLGGGLIVLGVGSLVFIVANKAADSPTVKTAVNAVP